MKNTSLVLLLVVLTIDVCANEQWITIEPLNKAEVPRQETKLDLDLSQIRPIEKMMKNATVVKQLLDAASKVEKQTGNDQKWFVLDTEGTK